MELQNLMRQGASGDRQRYQEELKELGDQRISLRTELDDDTYDRFLFESGMNNRVKVASIMPGSPAESNGFEKNDVILYYGDSRIIEGGDVRKAAWGGDVNSYVDVAISRDGNQMMLTVPGGTLGVRLEPIQVDPGQ
jgi:S1-C subfamily serine protease